MILKIATGDGWVLLDHIDRIKLMYGAETPPFRVHKETAEVEVFARDSEGGLGSWKPCTRPEYMQITESRNLRDGDHFYPVAAAVKRGNTEEIVLLTQGYLLNDDGRTIEHLNS